MTMPRPPAEIAWLTDVVGVDAAIALMELFGGTHAYIPKFFDPEMELVQKLGAAAAKALVQRWGGGRIRIPTCKWWRARVYEARGMTYVAIALKLAVSDISVWRWLNPDKAPVSQLSLPLGD